MRKIILLITTILLTQVTAFSQVGIGTTSPNASSMLDITSSNSGLLIPRMTEAEKLAIASPATGLLVFQTDAVSGFWYFNGTIWTNFSASSGWNLTGNAGTNSSLNFLGTTDDNDLILKRNNINSGYLGLTNTSFGVGALNPITTGNNNIAIGSNSLASNTTGTSNTAIGTESLKLNTFGTRNTATGYQSLSKSLSNDNTATGFGSLSNTIGGSQNSAFGSYSLFSNSNGSNNTAFGYASLRTNSNGFSNTAIGINALFSNATGSNNTAIGDSAIYSNTIGEYNTVSGYNALYTNTIGNLNTATGSLSMYFNLSGNNNAAFGNNSLFTNSTGSNNTSIGDGSLFSNSIGTGNVALGYHAGFFETANNKLYIENSDADAVNALIYGEFDTNVLRINGRLQIGNPTTTGYNFPLTRGTIGQVLQTDATGNVTWQTPASGGSAWNLIGNAGTNPATNFIGTTDNANIVFRRNNVRAGLIGINTVSLGVNALNPLSTGVHNIALGVSSLSTNTTGGYNISIGFGTMLKNTTGNFNTAIGNQALIENLSGISNAAYGDYAARSNVSGHQNAAFGTNALITNASGSQNSAYGIGSLYFVNGSFNTGLGYFALSNLQTGDNNVGIGNQAQVPNINGSNQLSIGNQIYGTNMNDAFLGKIGIGESNPTEKLDVSGSIKFSGSLMPNNTAGNLGEVLSSNGGGAFPTWVDPNVKPYSTTSGAGVYNVSLSEYTVRVFNTIANVRLPDAVANLGKVFIIIGSNGIAPKTFSTSGGGIYDDVTNATINTLNANQRYMVQSDGTNWIVIGR